MHGQVAVVRLPSRVSRARAPPSSTTIRRSKLALLPSLWDDKVSAVSVGKGGLLLVVAVAAPEGEHVREHVVGDSHVQKKPRLHARATRTMATARRQLPAEGDELLARLG